ncbi:AAA family ATPase [Streptomyces sp. NRRL S-350]|uniref:AAA family ATPase n=1 Tax=Streptomyces sp. NRRL S-350 TaxID=1463902 RepID=UPI00068EE0BD|nr:AAA family ATPase [Streptomyces sp. NRRL S-350]
MHAHIEVSTPIHSSARVLQASGLFDVPIEAKTTLSWDADLPLEDKDWNVGLIVGPSGSGKSTLARHLWPDQLATTYDWSTDRSLMDDFPAKMSVRQIVALLNAVGLSSPPAWLRPHHTLSNGEAFRATIARALAETDDADTVVIDEFTSVVDRQVAKVASHTVQKTVRRQKRQLVAVTCHYDVEDWLQPDWVYDVAAGSFSWRSVQPHPELELRIHRVDRAVWPTFSRHHYLSADLAKSAQCYGGWIDGQLVAFTSYIHLPHSKIRDMKMAHRTVVLPDFQGLGIAGKMVEFVGQSLHEKGYRFRRVIAHPAVIAYCLRSPRWRENEKPGGRSNLRSRSVSPALRARFADPRRLLTRSFEYQPPAKR